MATVNDVKWTIFDHEMLVLLLYSTANATILNCGFNCSWVDVPTTTWVQTFKIETGTSETTELYTYKPTQVNSNYPEREGPSDSYICDQLLNGLAEYGDYELRPTSGSDNQTLYKDGQAVRECNFRYLPVGNSRTHVSKRINQSGPVSTSWTTLVEGGHWVEASGGYWDCIPKPVPEPATMLLFGTGLVVFAGSLFRKTKK